MIINIKDPRVNQAIEYVKNKHNVPEGKEFYQYLKSNIIVKWLPILTICYV